MTKSWIINKISIIIKYLSRFLERLLSFVEWYQFRAVTLKELASLQEASDGGNNTSRPNEYAKL